MPVTVAVEGVTDEIVVHAVLRSLGAEIGPVYGRRGKPHLLSRLSGYNQAARYSPWLVLLDLDHDADCPPPYVESLLLHWEPRMCFRVAVRAVESWLLGDVERLAAFLGISCALLSDNPETLADPKAELVNLARRSRRRAIREQVVPRPGSGRRVGVGYTNFVSDFVTADRGWRPDIAGQHCESLRRAVACMKRLRDREG